MKGPSIGAYSAALLLGIVLVHCKASCNRTAHRDRDASSEGDGPVAPDAATEWAITEEPRVLRRVGGNLRWWDVAPGTGSRPPDVVWATHEDSWRLFHEQLPADATSALPGPVIEVAYSWGVTYRDLLTLQQGAYVAVFIGLNPDRFPMPWYAWAPGGALNELAFCDYPDDFVYAGAAGVADTFWIALTNNCNGACGSLPAIGFVESSPSGPTGRHVCEPVPRQPALFALHPRQKLAAALFLGEMRILQFDADGGVISRVSDSSAPGYRWLSFHPTDGTLWGQRGTGASSAFDEIRVSGGAIQRVESPLTSFFERIRGATPTSVGVLFIGDPKTQYDGGASWLLVELDSTHNPVNAWRFPWLQSGTPRIVESANGLYALWLETITTDSGLESILMGRQLVRRGLGDAPP